ncbi:unnamed protein product [Paramecium primaurelia]|uniref:Small ribosomal subunit protein uS2 n=1 Tax=Paramecium primaurelia TaxID=5886 RepID=A0A8S1MR77_PARPR|nr:unnamed protein product [Paramecium primaurelia]
MSRKEQDIKRLIASQCHIGTKQLQFDMKRYVSHRSDNGAYILNLEETWQHIKLAARVIAAVEQPQDVMVVSSRPIGQRAVIKFAHYTHASSTRSSRWTPGTLTNQSNSASGKFQEPQLLIVTDPHLDKQAIVEASYVNIPVIALCNSDNLLQYVDIPIPVGNRETKSISMIYWLLAREVKILRGELRQDEEWDVLVDLFYHKEITNDQLGVADNQVKQEGDGEEQEQQGDAEKADKEW